jgi:glycosyltransferase involved in cell wall biosynthesis
MKILFLSFYFPPDLCAGSFRAKSLIDALKRDERSVMIDVLTTIPNRYESFTKSSNEFENHEGVTIRRIELPQHKSGMFDQSKAFLKYFVNVLKFIKGKDYDLVFATSSRLMTAFLGAHISSKIGKPLYLDVRDIFTDTMRDILSPKISIFINPILNLIERITFSKADHINLVSEGFLQYFKKRYPLKKYSFYSNGIDEVFLKKQDSKANVKKNKTTILYAGNIGEGQGLNDFLPLFAQKTKHKYHYRIVGDGGKRKSLEKNLKLLNTKNVDIIDPIERSELLQEYKNADILFLHLNNYNAFKKVLPSKIFEYAAMGKPILAGVSGFSAEFLTKYVKNSVVFEPCNLKQATNSLKLLDVSHTNRDSFIQKFSRSKIMNDMAVSILSVTITKSRK